MKQKNVSHNKFLIIMSVALSILGVGILLSAYFISHYPHVAEQYVLYIFPIITRPFVFFSNLIPISLTEVFIVSFSITLPLFIVLIIYRFVRSKRKKDFVIRAGAFISVVFFFLSTFFTFFHGYNYSRIPLEETLKLESEITDPDIEVLAEVFEWVVMGLKQAALELKTDEHGRTMLLSDQITMFHDASIAMDLAADNISVVLSGNTVKSKPVALSSLWSYTQIAGMYNPFFLESNINIDIPEYRLPMVVTHEISHVRGIAREGDANMAAFLACISSPRADFRYSGYLFAFSYISSDVLLMDRDRYFEIVQLLPEQVFIDLIYSHEYWQQFEGPAAEVSTQVNDSYLRVNRQEEGVLSYSLVSGLIVSYYYTYEYGQES